MIDRLTLSLLFGLAVGLPGIVAVCIQTFVMSYCDPKFGCVGTFQFVATFFIAPAMVLTALSAFVGSWRYSPPLQACVGPACGLGIMVSIGFYLSSYISLPITFPVMLSIFGVLLAIIPFALCAIIAHRQSHPST